LASIDVDTSKLNELIKNLNNSSRDQRLENVKDVLTTVLKCINGKQYMEAAQLVFTVMAITNNY